MNKSTVEMQIVNPHAAGIDVGSRFHLVSVGQCAEDVRQFGVYNCDLAAIIAWLKVRGVTTVAMESTGTYWQSLYAALVAAGFEVFLCNGKFTKNMKGYSKAEYKIKNRDLRRR